MGDSPFRTSSTGGTPQPTKPDESSTQSTGQHQDNDGRRDAQYPTQPSYNAQYQYSHEPQHHGRADAFNMNPFNAALPDVPYQSYGSQRNSVANSSGAMYPVHNMQQYPAQPNIGQPAQVPYNISYQGQYQGVYGSGHSPSPPHLQTGNPGVGQFYPSQGYVGQQHQQQQQQLAQQYFIQHQYGSQSPMFPGMSSPSQYGGRSNSFPVEGSYSTQQRSSEFSRPNQTGGDGGVQRSVGAGANPSSVVRGPPRKPRQSGHAIWIGNLPPQTELMQLVSHVCKEAPGLESLFLISKSNCAFANYKDEASCTEAQAKIHDSKFQTVRLGSRLRRGSAPVAGAVVPTGPAALSPPLNPPVARSPLPNHVSKGKAHPAEEADGVDGLLETKRESSMPNDKFFIVKSLTVEDLELSVRNGIWATQSHNEETLNKAFKDADNVYLIFSANKSGEYFGYARMISPINDDPAAAIQFAPMAQTVEDPKLPKTIPTAATEFTPKGRIIDDSARGTIFWEADRDEEDNEDDTDSNKSDIDSTPPSKAWGRLFKIEWVSTIRLPFYRTRGMHNPWNSNREVKIARDGTELETEIGRRLISLFYRVSPTPPQSVPMQGMRMPMPGYPLTHP